MVFLYQQTAGFLTSVPDTPLYSETFLMISFLQQDIHPAAFPKQTLQWLWSSLDRIFPDTVTRSYRLPTCFPFNRSSLHRIHGTDCPYSVFLIVPLFQEKYNIKFFARLQEKAGYCKMGTRQSQILNYLSHIPTERGQNIAEKTNRKLFRM